MKINLEESFKKSTMGIRSLKYLFLFLSMAICQVSWAQGHQVDHSDELQTLAIEVQKSHTEILAQRDILAQLRDILAQLEKSRVDACQEIWDLELEALLINRVLPVRNALHNFYALFDESEKSELKHLTTAIFRTTNVDSEILSYQAALYDLLKDGVINRLHELTRIGNETSQYHAEHREDEVLAQRKNIIMRLSRKVPNDLNQSKPNYFFLPTLVVKSEKSEHISDQAGNVIYILNSKIHGFFHYAPEQVESTERQSVVIEIWPSILPEDQSDRYYDGLLAYNSYRLPQVCPTPLKNEYDYNSKYLDRQISQVLGFPVSLFANVERDNAAYDLHLIIENDLTLLNDSESDQDVQNKS